MSLRRSMWCSSAGSHWLLICRFEGGRGEMASEASGGEMGGGGGRRTRSKTSWRESAVYSSAANRDWPSISCQPSPRLPKLSSAPDEQSSGSVPHPSSPLFAPPRKPQTRTTMTPHGTPLEALRSPQRPRPPALSTSMRLAQRAEKLPLLIETHVKEG